MGAASLPLVKGGVFRDIEVDGKTFKFYLDSGANEVYMDPETSKATAKTIAVHGFGGASTACSAGVKTLKRGARQLDVEVWLHPMVRTFGAQGVLGRKAWAGLGFGIVDADEGEEAYRAKQGAYTHDIVAAARDDGEEGNVQFGDVAMKQTEKWRARITAAARAAATRRRKCNWIKHRITLKADAVLRHNRGPTLTPEQLKMQRELVEELLREGNIERAAPGAAERSPWVMVPKKDTTELRITQNLRHLNSQIEPVQYPSVRIADFNKKMHGAKIFSKIDCRKAFWSIPLDEASRKYTAFEVEGMGVFQWTVLPMGLKDSSNTLQQVLDEVLIRFAKNVKAYMDDIIIFSTTIEEHFQLLQDVFAALAEAGLCVNLEKSVIAASEVEFLSITYSSNGSRPSEKYLEALDRLPVPTTKKELQQVIGAIGYYRRFIRHATELMEPLQRAMPTKERPNALKEADIATLQAAMGAVREQLRGAATLSFPDFHRPFQIYSDASDVGIGGVLQQEGRPVAFFSRRLSDTERRYSVPKREAMAIVECLDYFNGITGDTLVFLYTDHKPLVYIFEHAQRQSIVARWLARALMHNVVVRHIEGEQNKIADLLSRLGMQTETEAVEKTYKAAAARTLVPLAREQYEMTMAIHVRLHHAGSGRMMTMMREGRVDGWQPFDGWTYAVVNTLACCDTCQRASGAPAPFPIHGAAHPVDVYDTVSIDVVTIGPGNIKLLVIVCAFSRFAWVRPVADETAGTLARALLDVIRQFGAPRRVHSDNGKAFISELFETLASLYKMDLSTTTPYSPYQNGTAERFNRTLLEILRALVIDGSTVTAGLIAEVVSMYNATVHSSTGVAPAELIFNYKLRHVAMQGNRATLTTTKLDSDSALEAARARVRALNDKAAVKRAEEILAGRMRIRPNQAILVWSVSKSVTAGRKLRPDRYDGPYRVETATLSTVTYSTEKGAQTVAINQCKPYYTYETHIYWQTLEAREKGPVNQSIMKGQAEFQVRAMDKEDKVLQEEIHVNNDWEEELPEYEMIGRDQDDGAVEVEEIEEEEDEDEEEDDDDVTPRLSPILGPHRVRRRVERFKPG